jgi:anti-sigma-K factor RskA
MQHSDYQELLALQAVEALDAPDAQAMRAHLESCAECRGELATLSDAAALLAHTAAPVVPSDEVRRRILSDVQGSRQSRVAKQVVPLSPRSSTLWPLVLRLAAGIAFVALFLGIIVLWRRDATARREIVSLARQQNQQQRELQIARDKLTQQSEALALLNSPDAKKIALSGTTTAQTAHATLVYDQKTRHGVLMIDGLPATPADKAYEVWFIPKASAPIPGRTFTVNTDGRALISDSLPLEAGSAAVVAITLEPKSGSAAPTGPIYLASPAS